MLWGFKITNMYFILILVIQVDLRPWRVNQVFASYEALAKANIEEQQVGGIISTDWKIDFAKWNTRLWVLTVVVLK
jgi:hypothetical protein